MVVHFVDISRIVDHHCLIFIFIIILHTNSLDQWKPDKIESTFDVLFVSGVEIKYELYNPLLQNIEILRLEKRLDEELFYLRDCPAEYSTIPFDMEPVILPKGSDVPLNIVKVSILYSEICLKWTLNKQKHV